MPASKRVERSLRGADTRGNRRHLASQEQQQAAGGKQSQNYGPDHSNLHDGLWKALWALIFGYIISARIQVLITRDQMARILGDRGPHQAGVAGFFGFISSSCSFAALAASRSILVKGAHPMNALAFLIASSNW